MSPRNLYDSATERPKKAPVNFGIIEDIFKKFSNSVVKG